MRELWKRRATAVLDEVFCHAVVQWDRPNMPRRIVCELAAWGSEDLFKMMSGVESDENSGVRACPLCLQRVETFVVRWRKKTSKFSDNLRTLAFLAKKFV